MMDALTAANMPTYNVEVTNDFAPVQVSPLDFIGREWNACVRARIPFVDEFS